jgi:acylpyruvate hydrolase
LIIARAQLDGGTAVVGVVDGDLFRPVAETNLEPGASVDREGVLAGISAALAGAVDAPHQLTSVRLLTPVPRPGKIICVGANYAAHIEEAGAKVPSYPEIFAKFANTVIGPGDEIPSDGPDPQIDWEGELAVVVGRRARNLAEREALSAVAGYTVANDVSARGWQTRVSQWVTGKSFDGFCPVGPWLVTADEIPDPQSLHLTTRLNGEVVQSASTSAMLFSVAYLIAYLSSVITLEPGDLILTGTPEGVGLSRNPPRFLRAGDLISVEVDEIGELANTVGPR